MNSNLIYFVIDWPTPNQKKMIISLTCRVQSIATVGVRTLNHHRLQVRPNTRQQSKGTKQNLVELHVKFWFDFSTVLKLLIWSGMWVSKYWRRLSRHKFKAEVMTGCRLYRGHYWTRQIGHSKASFIWNKTNQWHFRNCFYY